jgi:site-specific recombinase XerD
MADEDWDSLVRDFVLSRNWKARTREAYSSGVRLFLRWCRENSIDPTAASRGDIASFLASEPSWADDTVVLRAQSVRYFFDYLARVGKTGTNPALGFGIGRARSNTRDVLTLQQLTHLWESAQGQDRVIIGLLGICGVRLAEILAARVEHFTSHEGILVMATPDRNGPHEFDHVALPPNVASAIRAQIASRRSGPLLLGDRGRTIVTRRAVQYAIARAAKGIETSFRITPMTLTFTLRAIALDNRFSYPSVIRSVSEAEPRRLAAWVRRIHVPYTEHASYRLGQMVNAAQDADEEMLLRAEVLIDDLSQSPAAGLMLAAATLERALRDATARAEIRVDKSDPSLRTYADRLVGRRRISAADHNTIVRVLDFRNDAAHGWFERITRADAIWVLSEARSLAPRLRAIESSNGVQAGPSALGG